MRLEVVSLKNGHEIILQIERRQYSGIWLVYIYNSLLNRHMLFILVLLCLIIQPLSSATCNSGSFLYNKQCLCSYGYYKNISGCFPCAQRSCFIRTQSSVEIHKEKVLNYTTTLLITVTIPPTVWYIQTASSSFDINVKVNGIRYTKTANFNRTSNQILIQLAQIPSFHSLDISLNGRISSNDSMFLINNGKNTFFWTVMADLQVQLPTSAQPIVRTLSLAFTYTDKTVPILLLVALLVGQKLQAFSIFQTASLIYLAAFINLDSAYSDIQSLIRSIFILQPTPVLQLISSNSLAQVFKIDQSLVQYNSNLFLYTSGQLYFLLQVNSIITLVIQIALVVGLIKMLKCLLLPSINKVMPQIATNSNRYRFDLRRSSIGAKGQIVWRSQALLRSCASFRQKVYFRLCVMQTKKYEILTPLIMMQLLSHSLFIFYQFTLPIYSSHSLLSRILAGIILLIILVYPYFLISEQPLSVLKSANVLSKRRKYTNYGLWIYFYCLYFQSVIYAFVVVMFESGIYQTSIITILCVAKLIYLRKVMKKIEIIKQVSIAAFFGCLLLMSVLPTGLSYYMKETTIVLILVILGCQLMKIIKSILVFILNIFKQKQQQKQIGIQRQTQTKLSINESLPKQPIFQSMHSLIPYQKPIRPRKLRKLKQGKRQNDHNIYVDEGKGLRPPNSKQ